jgi:ADP-ribosyl-[dinitrogen reductase] hydrolase
MMTLTPRDALDAFTGCLLGGAVGDALGAPVEFASLAAIRSRFGPQGVTDLNQVFPASAAAEFTDDTQMTLFTAEGLLGARSHPPCTPTPGAPVAIGDAVRALWHAYLRWLRTQGLEPKFPPPGWEPHAGWLMSLPALHRQQAPGNTCLAALHSGRRGAPEAPLNNSKGCGGVMRVAPVGLVGAALRGPDGVVDLGCRAAAITHGHPSGYLAAGCLAEIIARIVAGGTLSEAVTAAETTLRTWTGSEEVLAALERARTLAAETAPGPARPTAEAVERLGAGWVAEEALAIAVYCALVYPTDFRAAVCLAVNHGGDSDSTGAITGNILGALLGRGAIPPEWLARLELRAEIEAVAGDLLLTLRLDAGAAARLAAKYPD